eukprot:scaffold1640_cov37-Tisochrysis_lutea.AAC.2
MAYFRDVGCGCAGYGYECTSFTSPCGWLLAPPPESVSTGRCCQSAARASATTSATVWPGDVKTFQQSASLKVVHWMMQGWLPRERIIASRSASKRGIVSAVARPYF